MNGEGCEFDHPHDHPCGQRHEQPGTPCRFCGDPVPVNGDPCPKCWTPATVPAFRGFAAAQGWDTTVTPATCSVPGCVQPTVELSDLCGWHLGGIPEQDAPRSPR